MYFTSAPLAWLKQTMVLLVIDFLRIPSAKGKERMSWGINAINRCDVTDSPSARDVTTVR